MPTTRQMRRVRDRIRRYFRHHGAANTLFFLAYSLINRSIVMLAFKVLILLRSDMDWGLAAGFGDEWGFLDFESLKQFAHSDPSLNLDDTFLSEAAARGDRCYGFVENGILGSYTWYSNRPTAMQSGVVAHFDRDYVYMYKAYTVPAFRGRRLYGIGVTRAAEVLLQEGGYKGMLCYVEGHNQPSLKALQRIGFKAVGQSVILGWKTPSISYTSTGCQSLFRAEVHSGHE